MFSFSLVSLISGALSLILSFLALWGGAAFVPLILALVSLGFGAYGIMREKGKNGLALVGLACALLGLIITLICFACSGCTACRARQMLGELNSLASYFS